MKSEFEVAPTSFRPIKVGITLETPEELAAFLWLTAAVSNNFVRYTVAQNLQKWLGTDEAVSSDTDSQAAQQFNVVADAASGGTYSILDESARNGLFDNLDKLIDGPTWRKLSHKLFEARSQA